MRIGINDEIIADNIKFNTYIVLIRFEFVRNIGTDDIPYATIHTMS